MCAEIPKSEDQNVPAVIDRIEDDVAVVLVGADEREITCSANVLPSGFGQEARFVCGSTATAFFTWRPIPTRMR